MIWFSKLFGPVIGKAIGILSAVSLVLGAAGFLVHEVNGAYDRGAEARDQVWETKLSLATEQSKMAQQKAHDAGATEHANELKRAQERATSAEAALEKAKADDPTVDQALNTSLPRAYFDSVCNGRANCNPPPDHY